MPCSPRRRALSARAQGACTWPPNGLRMHRRQSPISSRKRSTTMVRSVGSDAGRGALVGEVAQQVLAGERVELVRASRRRAAARSSGSVEISRTKAPTARPSSRAGRRPRRARTGSGPAAPGAGETSTRSRVIASMRQRGRAEQERLADARLVDHLLVELAHAARAVGQEDAVEPAVGDGAGVGDRQRARVRAAVQDVGHAVPHDPRAQLGELVRRVAAGQHVEHALELRARQLAVRVGAPHERLEVVDRPLLHGAHGDDLLGQHVEGVARDARGLDEAVAHAVDDHRALDEVAAVLGEDAAAAGLADLVAGAADALQPARDAARRLDLHHEVDRAHVDAELQRARGHEAAAGARPSAASSISTRASRASEPWWARATSSPASSLRRRARRSARRR